MLKACSDSVDVTDLQFKLQCRLKIFENNDASTFSSANSLLSCASRYGLLFVGTNSKFFQVIQTQKLYSYTPKDKDVTEYPRRNIDLPSSPKHLCVNCDNTIIAVVVEKAQCPVVIFYDVLSFFTQNIRIIKEIRLSSTPSVYVKEINWNPSLPAIFTACKSDGTLGVYELKGESVDFNELPAASGATCFCWSPKGKQIAVGSKDGKITQYKPDLKAVKVINEPQFGDSRMLISLQWVSNYQFIGVYQSVQQGSSSVVVVDAPKTGEPSYTNFDDICYSGSSRPSQFYLILQQNWNFLMVASANSSEVGVLGSSGDSWTQWIMSDTARAELPLSPDHQETLPVGLTFDISSTTPLPWGESSIPPCPLLCMLSHQGVLCCFNVVYLKEGVPTVCTPADTVQDTSGLSSFITTSVVKISAPEGVQFKPAQPAPTYIQFGMGQTSQPILPPISKSTPLSAPKATVQFTPPTQSTPLLTGKMATDLTSKNLFGSQATLTPIKPQQPSQGASLFGGQTLITPISKGPNVPVSIISSTVTQGIDVSNEKYASIFASLNPTTLPPVSTVPVKPIVISATASAPKPAATTPKLTATVQPSEISNTRVTEVAASTAQPKQVISFKQESQLVDPKLKAETRAMLSQMIRDEWMYLEAELKVLLNQGRALKISLGTDEEKVKMIRHLESLQEFVKEAVEISVGQSSEIHCLKQNIIQSWAWFEEANSYYNSSKNETVALLLKLQPLDSVSQKRLKDIEQLTYYIESQLQQTSKTLDEQWGNFQDYAKKTYRVQMPTMEAIFQTMVSQSAILQRQTYILKDIAMRLKKKTFGVSSLLLSEKAENLADDLKELRLDAKDILQLQYDKLKNHSKILSNKKANMLRSLLKQREVTHVIAVRPQLSAWTINQSPASKMRQSISSLGTHMTPVSKSPVAKSLNFVQSIPLKESDISKPTQVNQGLTFSLGSPDKPSYLITSNASPAPSGFVSLSKSGPGISNSQGSAFAPIGFAATSSAASENQIFSKTSLPTMPFSFGGTPTSKTLSSLAEIKPSFSSSPLFTASAVGTTAISGQAVNLVSNSSSIFTPTYNTSSVKPQSTQSTTTTASFAFAFGSSNTSAKGIFGAASATTSSVTGSNNSFFSSSPSNTSLFLTSSSTEANSSNTQVIKPTSVAATIIPNVGIKPVQVSTSSGIFGSQQSSFAPLSKSPSVTTIPTAVSTSTPSKAPSGVASIFENIQSVIDKATGSTGTTTTVTEPSKPTLPYDNSIGSITTTTQSLFGSVSSTATTKPAFETTTLSSTGGIFGSISKPVEAFKSISNTPSIFGSSFITTQPSKQETLLPSSDTPSSHESMIPVETAKESSSVITSPEHASKPLSGINSPVSANVAGVKSESSTVPNTTQISIFESKPTSPPSNITVEVNTTSTTPSIFSSNATTTTQKSGVNIFGAGVTTSLTAGSETTTSIFGSSKNSSPILPLVSEPKSQSTSIFGNASDSTAAASNIFGSSTPTSTPPSNIFVSGNAGSIFGSSGSTAAAESKAFDTSSSVFGTPPTSKNIFGTPTTSVFAPATTSSSSFPATATVSAFGTSTTSSNMFGTSGSIFGGNATTLANNIFGTSTTTIANVFGTSTSTPSANIFASAAPASTTQNVFGSTTSNATAPFGTQGQGGSIFGTPKTTDTVFGQPSVFGSQATTASSIFGQSATFGSVNADFGSSTTTTSGNIFGSAVSSSSEFGPGFSAVSPTNTFGSQGATLSQPTGSFGFGSLNVDGTSSSPGSIFGSNSSSAFGATPAANPFGKVEAKPPFGSSGASIFGNSPSAAATPNIFASPTTTTSSVFGSGGGTTFGANSTGGAFGSTNTFGSSAFGQKPTFGQTSAFGSNTFGSPQSGAFSGGGTSPIAQSGFGTSAAFQKPSGFGSSPVFGGSSNTAFGAAPSFGGAPAFGSAPTFGSPEKVFGGAPAASGGFGAAATQQSPGFGNLASQNTIGFGNLAQQASTPASSPFSSGNSSFSSWR